MYDKSEVAELAQLVDELRRYKQRLEDAKRELINEINAFKEDAVNRESE